MTEIEECVHLLRETRVRLDDAEIEVARCVDELKAAEERARDAHKAFRAARDAMIGAALGYVPCE